MKKLQIILMAVLLAASAGYSALLTVDFEGQAAGTQPTGAAFIRPTANNTTQAVQVVNSTLLGGNQAVQYLDRSTQSTATSLQYNFASNGAVMTSFSFSPNYVGGSSANFVEIGLSQQVNVSSSANMFSGVRIRADGSIGFITGGSGINVVNGLATGSVNTVVMFSNDTASDTTYTRGGSTITLLANTTDYYFNDVLTLSGATFGTTVGTLGTTNGFGRFAMFDSTARVDLDILFDNIQVDVIPEPATMGMLLLGSVVVLAIRRRRA
jgi:hypothetical protein